MRDDEDDDKSAASAHAREIGSSRDVRVRERTEAYGRRAIERATMAQERTERRTVERNLAAQERQAIRDARQRETEERMSSLRPVSPDDGAAPNEPKRRASGSLRRTGELRVECDTRNFKTVVDSRRIRELSRRGAKVEGLAAVFGISVEEIVAALAQTD